MRNLDFRLWNSSGRSIDSISPGHSCEIKIGTIISWWTSLCMRRIECVTRAVNIISIRPSDQQFSRLCKQSSQSWDDDHAWLRCLGSIVFFLLLFQARGMYGKHTLPFAMRAFLYKNSFLPRKPYSLSVFCILFALQTKFFWWSILPRLAISMVGNLCNC